MSETTLLPCPLRAAFEVWISAPPRGVSVERLPDDYANPQIAGKYLSQTAGIAWEAWQAASVSPWQPIETAPRDGTPVDLWITLSGGNAFRMADCYWRNERWEYHSLPEYGHSMELCPIESHWIPTHWLPLPKGPGG